MAKETMFTFEQLERRLRMKLGEDERLEFKSQLFRSKKGIKNPILTGVVALANAYGGNLIIGVTRQDQSWVISGTLLDREFVSDWLSQVVYEYVHPDRLPFEVYTIESTGKSLKCVGILVRKLAGIYFAIRYSGRSSKSKAKQSYFFPMRIGSSTRLLDSLSFIRHVFNSWVIGISEISKQKIFPTPSPRDERRFNLEDFNLRVSELGEIKEKTTRRWLVQDLRHTLVNLPFDNIEPWNRNLRKSVFELLDILYDEISTEDVAWKDRVVDMLHIVAKRADKKTLEKIDQYFLEILKQDYVDPKIRKSSNLIRLLQVLHHYDPDYMEKMIIDALESWNITDFSQRFNDIEVDRYLSKHPDRRKELRLYVLRKIEVARKSQNNQMRERFEKMYNRIRSVV